jgi:predicted CXXCH cytochrome family protein
MTAGYLLLALGTAGAVLYVSRGRGSALLGLAVVLLAVVLALAWQPPRSPHAALPAVRPEGGYVGSSACRACHAGEHASWQVTHHRSMTRVADRSSVRPAFPVRLELDGRSFELSDDGEGSFSVVGPDLHLWGSALAELGRLGPEDPDAMRRRAARLMAELPRVRRELVLVTGSHHYQAFWVEGGEGRELRQLPFVYLLDDALPETERWIPRRDAFLQPPDALPHVARWNANCVQCHSVGGRPGLSEATGGGKSHFATEVAEFGIGCEACHGAGRAHVEHYQSPLARLAAEGNPRGVVQPARLDAHLGSAVCGQCHSYFVPLDADRWWQSGFSEVFRPGQSLNASRLIVDYERDRATPGLLSRGLDSVFWPDGTIRVGGREYNGLLLSPCYERGAGERQLRCTSCHSMHDSDPNDQLGRGMESQQACTQCHESVERRLSEHTHHAAGSPGSDCYNCHMPRTTYALLKAIRSHRITSPQVDARADSAPNACNLCHLDRSLEWTAEWLERWWPRTGGEAANRPAGGDSLAETTPASVVWLLSGNAAQRVLLADGMAWPPAVAASGSSWLRPLLEGLSSDPYAAVRHVAARSLRQLDAQGPIRAALPDRRASLPSETLETLRARRNDDPITLSE